MDTIFTFVHFVCFAHFVYFTCFVHFVYFISSVVKSFAV
jgi:hypothetical protein